MYKELKLKANHNCNCELKNICQVVIKCTKSWSWKQITTRYISCFRSFKLLSNVQRAEVESKSQLGYERGAKVLSCYQMYKELKLKANHNSKLKVIKAAMLLSNVQRAEVESKSQLYECSEKTSRGCYQMYKELKLKANHNSTIAS